MYIRRLLDDEYEDVVKLITDTVHIVCKNDYTEEELNAWAPENFNIRKFRENLSPCLNLAAFEKGKLVGFLSMERSGYINRLYTHFKYQHRGIATALYKEAEHWAAEHGILELSLDSSKTAEGFYIKMGFKKSGISIVKHGSVVFRNTVMKKSLI
ncbi:MAG: GNAT family N-acetyltransferase [Clostridia bacterium]|nr:GNAT family N-acetyltransferase [Clostridia bacterium]